MCVVQAVKRAMAFLQPIMGSYGVLQYAYYAMLGYPYPPKAPRPSNQTVAMRLEEFVSLGQEFRQAIPAFLGRRRADLLTVEGGGGAIEAALYEYDSCLRLFAVNTKSTSTVVRFTVREVADAGACNASAGVGTGATNSSEFADVGRSARVGTGATNSSEFGDVGRSARVARVARPPTSVRGDARCVATVVSVTLQAWGVYNRTFQLTTFTTSPPPSPLLQTSTAAPSPPATSITLETPLLVDTRSVGRFWFPNTLTKLDNGTLLLRVSVHDDETMARNQAAVYVSHDNGVTFAAATPNCTTAAPDQCRLHTANGTWFQPTQSWPFATVRGALPGPYQNLLGVPYQVK